MGTMQEVREILALELARLRKEQESDDYMLVIDPTAEDGWRKIYMPTRPPHLPDCRFCRARYEDALHARGCLHCESRAREFERELRAAMFQTVVIEGPTQ